MKEKKILKKIFFPAKIASGQALFPPLVKAKNQHQNFEKHLKQKRYAKISYNRKKTPKMLHVCNL